MNMQETARLILALRSAGWTGDEIGDILLYIESGDEKYMPKADKHSEIKKEGEV